MSSDPVIYPPSRHLLRDLRIVIDRTPTNDGDSDVIARLESCPEIVDTRGRPRVGVLATLVDVVAGEIAIRSVRPNWTATSDLSVYVHEVPARGSIEVSARVMRSGRQTVVLEASLRGGDGGPEFGTAHVGFAVLPARSDIQSAGHWADAPATRTEFGLEGSGFDKPLLETIGIEFGNDDPSICRLPTLSNYLINSLDALQGGAVAILLEAAAEHFVASQLGGSVGIRSLAIHYLKLGRVGPIRSECRLVAPTAGGQLIRVTLFDEGAADVLLAVAMIQVDAATGVA